MSSNAQVRRRAVQAARGESPFDLLLVDAQIVDMATGEIRPADVGIVGEMIASVHPAAAAPTPIKCVPWPVAICRPA